MALPFNRVKLRQGERVSSLSVPEFKAMPLTERVRAVLEKRVQFFDDERPIEQNAALRALREAH